MREWDEVKQVRIMFQNRGTRKKKRIKVYNYDENKIQEENETVNEERKGRKY